MKIAIAELLSYNSRDMNQVTINTLLLDGTLDGARIIQNSTSTVRAFVVPRIRLSDIKNQAGLHQPAIYLLINVDEGQLYVGESEDFYERIKDHELKKPFWDRAIAIVSRDNTLAKHHVKYLESEVLRLARSGSMVIMNEKLSKAALVDEFAMPMLSSVMDDIRLLTGFIGLDIFTPVTGVAANEWRLRHKQTEARGMERNGQFVLLAGSKIDREYANNLQAKNPGFVAFRQAILREHGGATGSPVELAKDVAFKSANLAARFATGNSVNAWITWKDGSGRTMDEVIRQAQT